MKRQKVKKRPSGLSTKTLWAKPITDRRKLEAVKNWGWSVTWGRSNTYSSNSLYFEMKLLEKYMEIFGLTRKRCTYEQAKLMVSRLQDASHNLISLNETGIQRGSRVSRSFYVPDTSYPPPHDKYKQVEVFGKVEKITWNHQVKVRYLPNDYGWKTDTRPAGWFKKVEE